MTGKMRGYNLPLAGRPAGEVKTLPEPDVLRLALRTEHFHFAGNVLVDDGEAVCAGQALATDTDAFDLPLLAPRAGAVRRPAGDDVLVLERVQNSEAVNTELPAADLDGLSGPHRLVRLGAWSHLRDPRSGSVPDPDVQPSAIVVTTYAGEPFLVRGSTLLRLHFEAFLEGLKALQSLLEYQPIILLIPHITSALGEKIQAAVRGSAWVKVELLPARYPYGDPRLHLRKLGLSRSAGSAPIWSTDVAGVLAVHQALVQGRSVLDQVVTVGGPAARAPAHFRVMPGTPVGALLAAAEATGSPRIVRGGVLQGVALEENAATDLETRGLTVLPVPRDREFLAFLRPGTDRSSYSRCFLSALRRPSPEPMTTALRGEKRPCVACGLCEQVCPVEIFPHLIHRALYRDALEEAERLRLDLCIDCGLCSLVCPSKLDLGQQFRDARDRIQEELHPSEDGDV